jgi:phospholipid N-methyltransferase
METMTSTLKAESKLRAELRSFGGLWAGGYLEGDPMNPHSGSSYPVELSFMSILHVTYLTCIKPYITPATRAIEIGPGRGGWTKAILSSGAAEVYCLDALSASHNGFWDHVGPTSQVRYFEVSDFSCKELPADTFDYLFSFGCLCHVSPEGVEAYFRNLYSKLRGGANGFVMVADYEKYNRAIRQCKSGEIARSMFRARRLLPFRIQIQLIRKLMSEKQDESSEASPGRWYHLGTNEACRILKNCGYEVVDPDMGVNHRDPVIHFRKP